MNDRIVSAIFDNKSEAEAAARDLRQTGIPDSALSVIARHDEADGDFGDATTHEAKEHGEGALKGALAGGGVGALLGIAALAIPGVGPLAAAGAIAASAAPEAAAIGAGVGAVTGGLTGLLAKHGVSDDDASYYEERIHDGGVFLSVDTSEANLSASEIREILHRSGGHSASSPRRSSTEMAFGASEDRDAFGFNSERERGETPIEERSETFSTAGTGSTSTPEGGRY